jgi:hypothetical protein
MAIRNKEHSGNYDPFEESRRILDVVYDMLEVSGKANESPVDSDEVLEATGLVKADLYVLEDYLKRSRELSSGISPDGIAILEDQMKIAAAIRPLDDESTRRREMILKGLGDLRVATAINEIIGQRLDRGIAVVQMGIDPEKVGRTIGYVEDAKRLIEEAPRALPDPKVIEAESVRVIEEPKAPASTKAEGSIPKPRRLIRTDYPKPKVKEVPVDEIGTDIVGSSSRRGFLTNALKGGSVTVVGLIIGESMGWAPVSKGIGFVVDKLAGLDTEEKKIEAERAYIERYLQKTSAVANREGWHISTAVLDKDEELIDIIRGGHVWQTYRASDHTRTTPLFVSVENNPVQVASVSLGYEFFVPKYHPRMIALKFYLNGDVWELLHDKDLNMDEGKVLVKETVSVRNSQTGATFYLKVSPAKKIENDIFEVRYLKKVKKTQ